jgi:hypothetical protein
MPRGVYMDVHVPSAITDGLMRRGIDVLTAQADDAREMDDESLLQRASDLGRMLFTHDEDLLSIGAAWQQQSREFAGIVYAHQLRLGIGEIIEQLELLAACAIDEEILNAVIHLPLS